MSVQAPSEIEIRLRALLERQRSAFLAAGPPSLKQRRGDLMRLKGALLAHREDFVAAINADFGHRSRQETSLLELSPVIEGIKYLHRNLALWMRPERRKVSFHFFPGSTRVLYQPLGVVGVISPWNYPVALALMPLATALAAGNRVMIKPSEITPATSALMSAVLGEIFSLDQAAVATGEADVGMAFAALPFDHLVFTGSTPVGRSVMRAASDNLVPVTLELGGKSPVIVERGSCLKTTARRIAYGKLANGGQTCIAPDYVLAAAQEINDFVAAYAAEVEKLYPDIAANPDYTSIINDHHYARLVGLLDDARAKGARVIEIGAAPKEGERTNARTLAPAIVLGATDGMNVMKEEIFGPILPVIPYARLEEAVAYVNARPRPLALYFFGPDGPGRRMVLARTTSGGVSINETILHYAQDDIPFGGVGASGMGAYHGHEGFKTLSHSRGVFEQAKVNLTDVVRPPFGKLFERLVDFLLR
ncbi:coniferyl aldehyde dehydrogenase [Methylocapsa aurea]|uniref:coniferyl aldehyde dehydrogenase n=1 Tax=Methylocapsa aurea TaxID=663610 RepID=UPI00068A68D5|nr:coniferyl aldehyde dehydrogenase [Methylocapsa aurea]